MKILYFTFLILITTCNNLIGQDKENKYIVSCYEISLSQYPQIVKLIQFENQNYQGFIITKLYEGKVNRKSAKEILDSVKINPEIVQTLMIKLKNEGIETIKDCKDEEQCKSIAFLDGGQLALKFLQNH